MRASPAQAPVRVGAGGGQMLPEDDCWAMIMQCLKDEPAALCRCSEVCGAFHALCGNEDMWREICQRRWAGKLNKKLTPGKRASARQLDELGFQPIESAHAPAQDLQGAPARRACAAAVTSGQGRRNNAFPLWKLRCRDSVTRAAAAVRAGCAPARTNLTWKHARAHSHALAHSYFEAEWDSIRTNITIEEVTSHLWRFRFLHYPSPSFVVRYNPDFTYDSCMCVRECERERARQREMCMVWVRMCMVWVCCRVVMCQACVRISVHAGRQVCAYVCG